MNFKEWYDEDTHDLFNYPEEAMQDAWAAAIDEAVKIVLASNSYTAAPTANEIKELKG